MKMTNWRLAVVLISCLFASAAPGAETNGKSKSKAETKGPLAGLPSKPGPHIARIKALGDNGWLKLPDTAADPKCPSWRGKSYGRSWTPRASYCAELGGAFITGEAAHTGMDRKTGYYGDDVWFYDLYANRWINLYPGTHYPTLEKKFKDGTYRIDDKGIIRDKASMPIPAGTMTGHGGFLQDYDRANRKFFWVGTTCGWLTGPLRSAYEKRLKAQGKTKATTGLWAYDLASGRFERFAHAQLPWKSGSLNFYQYLPSTGRIMTCDLRGQEWWMDLKAGTVEKTKAKGDRPPRGSAYGSCYDSKRDRVYVFGAAKYGIPKEKFVPEDHFFYYDVKSKTWVKPKAKNSPAMNFAWGRFMMEYDSVNDRVMVMYITHRSAPEDRAIHVYDAETNQFAEPIPVSYKNLPKGYGHSFFCPELNAYFIHSASGDNFGGSTWVWRYKRAPKKK